MTKCQNFNIFKKFKSVFFKSIFPKCIYPKCIFAKMYFLQKCTRLACLLSFASLFLTLSSVVFFIACLEMDDLAVFPIVLSLTLTFIYYPSIYSPHFLSLKLTVSKGQQSLIGGDGSRSHGWWLLWKWGQWRCCLEKHK